MICPFCKKEIECKTCKRIKIQNCRKNYKYRKTIKGKKARKKDYEKNKIKYICRANTWWLAKEGKIYFKIPAICNRCGCQFTKDNNAQFHHEIYHSSRPQIIKDWQKGKIKLFCKRCNNELNRLVLEG